MIKNRLLGSVASLSRPLAPRDGYFNTVDLIGIVQSPLNAAPPGFWLQFFGRSFNSTSEKIMFDEIDVNERRLAPFVIPNAQGKVMASKGFSVKSFKPPYVKPKHVVDPSRTLTRRAGEAPLGSLTPGQRFALITADNLRTERAIIENRWDWMACQAVVDGSLHIVSEDYPDVTIDFGRDSSLTIALTGGAAWTENTATPIADIAAARKAAFSLSGYPVTKLIFGLEAWDAFIQSDHPDVQELLNTLKRGSTTDFNYANITDGGPYEYMGFIAGSGTGGRLELYTYSNLWEVNDDVEATAFTVAIGSGVPYFDPKKVVGVGGALDGVKAFGAIMDADAGLAALPMFPKQWKNPDPSVWYTMTQSAPLMIPLRPNNSFCITAVE